MGDATGHDAGRRRFLAAGAVATGSSVAGAMPAAGAMIEPPERLSVVLHDRRIPLDAALVRRFEADGTRVIALDEDPVRLWRSDLGSLLRDPATRLFGISRWSDLLIVRGLAAETRRHLRYEKLDAQAGTFTWLIA